MNLSTSPQVSDQSVQKEFLRTFVKHMVELKKAKAILLELKDSHSHEVIKQRQQIIDDIKIKSSEFVAYVKQTGLIKQSEEN